MMAAEDQGGDGADRGVEDDDGDEDGQDLPVGDGEGEHAPGGALLDPVLQDGPVLAHGAHAAPAATSTASHARGPAYSWLQPTVGASQTWSAARTGPVGGGPGPSALCQAAAVILRRMKVTTRKATARTAMVATMAAITFEPLQHEPRRNGVGHRATHGSTSCACRLPERSLVVAAATAAPAVTDQAAAASDTTPTIAAMTPTCRSITIAMPPDRDRKCHPALPVDFVHKGNGGGWSVLRRSLSATPMK